MGPHRYRIIVSGSLGELTRGVFEDLSVESDGTNTGITGDLDQAGLYGVLDRIQSFGLELVALSRLDDESLGRTRRVRRLGGGPRWVNGGMRPSLWPGTGRRRICPRRLPRN
jgi:hypothetical protein